jgi:hypothetical protein
MHAAIFAGPRSIKITDRPDPVVAMPTAADRDIQDQIDAAYRARYRRYAAGISSAITSPGARAATIKLVPP